MAEPGTMSEAVARRMNNGESYENINEPVEDPTNLDMNDKTGWTPADSDSNADLDPKWEDLDEPHVDKDEEDDFNSDED